MTRDAPVLRSYNPFVFCKLICDSLSHIACGYGFSFESDNGICNIPVINISQSLGIIRGGFANR